MAVADWQSIARALLGVSTYAPHRGVGPELDDASVERIRENLGGNLNSQPTTRIRWYLADLEAAQVAADSGNLMPAAQLWRAMRRDGVISGLMGSLTSGIVRLPKRFYGDQDQAKELRRNNGSRSVFDDMFPPSELALLASDGKALGVGVAELVPVDGRDFPVMVRLEPEFLVYRWPESRWYFRSVAGLLPITPGDGRWILHVPGGRQSPWLSGLWPALGRSFINKEHALLHRSNYSSKLANPARAAVAPAAATEAQRTGMLKRVIAWGVNTVFEMPPGWDVRLIESNGKGYEVFQAEIDTSDREITIAVAGQLVTTDGGSGFANADVHRLIRSDIIEDMAEQLAYTINTQGLPQWEATHFRDTPLSDGATLCYDAKQPKDQESEARSMMTVAQAVTALDAALAPHGVSADVGEITTRFAIPVVAEAIASESDDAPERASGGPLQ